MQCSRCGAYLRSGMAECPQCGAPVAQASGSGYDAHRAVDRYVPGGGAPPAPPMTSGALDYNQQQRPLGSLQRRLQRSQASIPNDDLDDDAWDDLPPARPAGRVSRPQGPAGQGYGSRGSRGSQGSGGPRRPSSGEGYGEPGRRSRPMEQGAASRGPRSGAGRPRSSQGRYDDDHDGDEGYGGYDESREEPAYTPYPRYRGDDDLSRERPAARRHGRSDAHRRMDESAEMSAEGPAYGPPGRSAPRRRSRPIDNRDEDADDYTNPLDDPRSPLRGSESRRPSRGSNSGRSGGYPRYDEYGPAGYSEELPAPPAPPARGARGRGYATSYNLEDDFASREQWAAPGDSYAPHDDMPYDRAGGGMGYEPGFDRRAEPGFDRGMEVWQPVGAPDRAVGSRAEQARSSRGQRSGGKPAQKRKGGALRVVLSLLSVLALVAIVGIEFGPKVYQKYIAHNGGVGPTQTTTTCATEAAPSAQTKPPAGSSAFGTTAYTLTYPSGWQMTSQTGASEGQCDVVYLFSQPNGAAKFNVEEAGAFAALSDQQIIQAEAQSAQQQGSTFTEITSAATTQSIGGEVWQRREYQVTTKSSVKLHLALLAGHHKGNGFAIVLLSSDAGFSSDDTTTFEPMLHSFQFV